MCSVIKLYKYGTSFQKLRKQIFQRTSNTFATSFSTLVLKNCVRVELVSPGIEKKQQKPAVQWSPNLCTAPFSSRTLKKSEHVDLLPSSCEKVSKTFKKIQYSKLYVDVEIHEAWDMDALEEEVEEPQQFQDFKFEELPGICIPPDELPAKQQNPNPKTVGYFKGIETNEFNDIYDYPVDRPVQGTPTNEPNASATKLHEVHSQVNDRLQPGEAEYQSANGSANAEAAQQLSGTEIHEKVDKIPNFKESDELQTPLNDDLNASVAKDNEVEYPNETYDLCELSELPDTLGDPLLKDKGGKDPEAEATQQFSGTEIHDKVDTIFNFEESVDLQTPLTEDLYASSPKLHEVHTDKETEYPCAEGAAYTTGIEILELCDMSELADVLGDPRLKVRENEDPKVEAANQFSGTEAESILKLKKSVDAKVKCGKHNFFDTLIEPWNAQTILDDLLQAKATEYQSTEGPEFINGIDPYVLCEEGEDPKAEATNQFSQIEIDYTDESILELKESDDPEVNIFGIPNKRSNAKTMDFMDFQVHLPDHIPEKYLEIMFGKKFVKEIEERNSKLKQDRLSDDSDWPLKYLKKTFGEKTLSELMKKDKEDNIAAKKDKGDKGGKGQNDDF